MFLKILLLLLNSFLQKRICTLVGFGIVMKVIILSAILLATAIGVVTAENAGVSMQNNLTSLPLDASQAQPPLRVLIVNSYQPGWALEEDLASGVVEGLEREGFAAQKDYSLKVFWMDTKVNYTTLEEIMARGDAAMSLIDQWKPNIVFVNNDNALKYVAVAYTEKYPERDLPFVFAGTNIDPSVYKPIGSLEHPAGTITGTLERIPYEAAFSEAKNVIPNATRILLLSDASQSSVDNKNDFEAWYSSHMNESPLKVADFVQTNDVEQWKQVIEESQNSTDIDMIGFVAYQQIKDENGNAVPAADLARWTVGHNRLPELELIPDDVRYGMLMGAGISFLRTGMYGGIIGGQILKGTAPNRFPIIDPHVMELTFNRNRAEKLNVTIPVDSLVRADAVYE
jgi:ABC-type uncharacterized transport system substrate-binding protein